PGRRPARRLRGQRLHPSQELGGELAQPVAGRARRGEHRDVVAEASPPLGHQRGSPLGADEVGLRQGEHPRQPRETLVVGGQLATFGDARVRRASSEDLPALGRPTSPTSASSLSLSSSQPCSPGRPRSAKRGACRVAVAKRLLPLPPAPPRATVARWPSASSSHRRRASSPSLPSLTEISVPGGTRSVRVSPSRPWRWAPCP